MSGNHSINDLPPSAQKNSGEFQQYFAIESELNECINKVRSAPAAESHAELEKKVEKLLVLADLLSAKSRDDNAVIFQLFFSMEERINKRIDNLREELLREISAATR